MFFTLSSWQLALVLAGIVFGATVVGLVAGRSLSRHAETLREPLGIVQGALLTLVGLVLAFGLAMAVGRYDSRRTAVVNDANTIGTAYLRAQTLHEPVRGQSLPLYVQYTDASIRLSNAVPGSADAKSAIAEESALQRRLWGLAGTALADQPAQSAPRLYVESLNEMIDMQTTRVSALNNRVPRAILLVEVIGAAVALGLMALYLAALSRGVVTILLAAGLITLLLYVTFDLDRPARGLIEIPDAALVALRASMELRRRPTRPADGEPGRDEVAVPAELLQTQLDSARQQWRACAQRDRRDRHDAPRRAAPRRRTDRRDRPRRRSRCSVRRRRRPSARARARRPPLVNSIFALGNDWQLPVREDPARDVVGPLPLRRILALELVVEDPLVGRRPHRQRTDARR